MKSRRLSRRALLRGAGGIAVALPGLEAMFEGKAAAAGKPKRLILFYTPNGTNRLMDFYPKQTGTGFVLDMESAALEPLRNKLLMLSGITYASAKLDTPLGGDLHSIGLSHMLTGVRFIIDHSTYGKVGGNLSGGYAGGISVDQYLARKIGNQTKFPSLEFGVCTSTDAGPLPFSRMISAGPNMPVPSENDPVAMFTRIFSDNGGNATTAIDKAHAQRRSILDFVLDDLTRVGGKLGTSDKKKIDAHLTAIRDLESRLALPAPMVNLSCGMGTFPAMGNPLDKANFPVTGKQMMDLMILALKCDATRIASLQWSWARSTLVHTWAGATKSHHDMTHVGSSPELTGVNIWFSKQLAYFAQGLNAADEGDGTSVLDNSLLWWCSDVGEGYGHGYENIRAFILGTCGGAIKTGQHINMGGVPHQKLLVTLMNAMGLAENQFGDTTFGTGPLPGILT
jgi:hypothetical protein